MYKTDSSTSEFHDMVRELSHQTQTAEPSPFHHMIATLAEEGRLMRLYTQNIDGIDAAMKPLATKVPLNSKGPWPKTIQLHGGLNKMVCQKCGDIRDFDRALFEGPEPPLCEECEQSDIVRGAAGLRSHGIGRLRPRMVLYSEYNPDEEAIGAVSHADIKSRPDAVIVVGTSMKIPGLKRLVRELCAVTRDRRGGFTAWINLDPEPLGIDMKDCWDMVVRADCDEIARYVGLPRWDDKDLGEYRKVEGKEVKAAKKATGLLSVAVEPKQLDAIKTEGMITPTDSPRQQSPLPGAKLKQTSLSFAPPKTADNEKPTKTKKKGGRKALPSAKLPKEKITGNFTSTKKAKATTGKAAASNKVEAYNPFPNLQGGGCPNKPSSTPLRAASPAFSDASSGLSPPPSSIAEVIIYTDTISPSRVPSGMGHLLH